MASRWEPFVSGRDAVLFLRPRDPLRPRFPWLSRVTIGECGGAAACLRSPAGSAACHAGMRGTTRLSADACPLPDSVAVEVPVESREYAGEGYRAYVSGWQPRLDSLVLERPVYAATVAQPVAARTRRFSIALQAGYGMTPRGLLPYVGVGVSVRLF